MQVCEWAKRQFPAFRAVHAIGDEAEISKEDINILAVCDWSWRGWIVQLVQRFSTGGNDGSSPQNPAAGSIEAQGFEFFSPAPVRKMCCAVMTGDDAPSGSVVCQTRFNLGPNSVGNPAVSAMPDAFGPRNAGQSAAAADIDDITVHPTTSNLE